VSPRTLRRRDASREAGDRADRLGLAARHARADRMSTATTLAASWRSFTSIWHPLNRIERRRLRVQLVVIVVLTLALAVVSILAVRLAVAS
jgi:hypothetical protein